MGPGDTSIAGVEARNEPLTTIERLRLSLTLAKQCIEEGRTKTALECISDAESEVDEIDE